MRSLPCPEGGQFCDKCQYPIPSDCSGCLECVRRKKDDDKQRERWVERIGGMKAWNEYTLARFEESGYNYKALAAIKTFNWKKESILLCGPRGTGKSHLAAIAKRPLIMQGLDVITVSMPEVLGRVRTNIKDGKVLNGEIARMATVKVLSIEDMGVEKPSEFVVEFYYRVIDGRYKEAKNGMLITMNQSIEDLESAWRPFDQYGRVTSRLMEMCKIESLRGELDHRQNK